MPVSLKESRAATEMAKVLYSFLPASGARNWKGHVTFQTVAQEVGVGDFWQVGSKEPAIAALLERTLEFRRDRFEYLILAIVKAGMKYRQKNNKPITEDEIVILNGLILDVGFKFPALWDKDFLASLRNDGYARATEAFAREMSTQEFAEQSQSEFHKNRDKLRSIFYNLCALQDRQEAGLALERLLNELFELFELNPRGPFRVVGEQIDGSFELDSEIYLVEAKWESSPLSEAPLLVFRGKVEGKSTITRGLFISLNGYTEPALQAITQGKQPNFFLMDGYDLSVILEGHIDLCALLRTKIRILAEQGNVFVSAKDCQ